MNRKPAKGRVGIMDIAFSAGDGWSDRQRAAHDRVHTKRLETLVKGGVAKVVMRSDRDGKPIVWQLPKDFEKRAIEFDLKQGRASGVSVLSVQTLEQQFASPGATWLDRVQVSHAKGEIAARCAKSEPFARELDEAYKRRRV